MPPDLTRAVAAYKSVVQQMIAMFPEEAVADLADTIEGASVLDEVIIAVLRNAIEREAQADALGGLLKEMAARQHRLVDGAQRLRQAARDAMLECGLPKLNAPDMTIGIRDGKPKVLVTDPSAVPDDYCEFERKIRKREIGDALQAGVTVPGATLGNPEPILTIRRS